MNDRIPAEGKAGRVLITPENGSAPFYATVTMADEPLDEGTPLNKATLLKDATAALLGGGADMVPDEAFAALWELIDTLTPAKVGAAQMVVLSYSGTGAVTDTVLTTGFRPKAAIIAAESYSIYAAGGSSAAGVSDVAVWVDGVTFAQGADYLSSAEDGYPGVAFTATDTGLILRHKHTHSSFGDAGTTYHCALFG